MRIAFFIALVLVVVLAAAAGAFVGYGRERTWALLTGPNDPGAYDFAKAPRRATGNDALACSPGLCSAADLTLPVYDLDPEDLVARLAERLIRIDPRARRVDDGRRAGYARFVTFSPVMRFPDAIDIEAVRTADGHTGVRAYSRAKLGAKDLGKNRDHLEQLFDGFAPQP